MIFKKHRPFFFNAYRDFNIENGGNHRPESVPRMTVEEHLLPAFDRREAAEYQRFAVPIPHGRKRMLNVNGFLFHMLISFRFGLSIRYIRKNTPKGAHAFRGERRKY